MNRLFQLIIVCALLLVSCKGEKPAAGNEGAEPVSPEVVAETKTETEPVTATPAAVENTFTFDELFRIFSCFGGNIMTDKFASQTVKDSIKEELRNSFDGAMEFVGSCNSLSYSLFDGDCYDGFQMACYRYKADGHILTCLLENGGCDVSSVKYIRYYEYDPAQGGAHEVDTPFSPVPKRDDFEDMVRLAGADLTALRDAMKAGSYDYEFRPEGVRVRLNDPMDFDEQAFHGDLVVDYLWDGSTMARNADYRYACIHAEGFGNILLGRPAPDFSFSYDPKGYKTVYSSGGDLWLISRDGVDGLEVQMDGGKVYSVEVRFPDYCVARSTYEAGPGKVQPYVGARINDCLTFGADDPRVGMLMDGTVQIEVERWNTWIAFRTSRESLVSPVEPSTNGRIELDNPKFKPDARIESILIWRE